MSGYDDSPDYGGPNPSKSGRKVVLLVLAFLVVMAVLATGASAEAMAMCPAKGKRVTCVVDGDTFWWRGEKIRLFDVDAPEITKAECAEELRLAADSAKGLVALLNGREWTLERHGLDPYKRTLAVVWIGNQSVGDALIDGGLAVRWTGSKANWC